MYGAYTVISSALKDLLMFKIEINFPNINQLGDSVDILGARCSLLLVEFLCNNR